MSGVTTFNTLTGAVSLTSGNPFIGIGAGVSNNVVATYLNTGISGLTVQGQTPADPLTSGQIIFVPGSNVTMATNSLANTLTINASGGSGTSITNGTGSNTGTVAVDASGNINMTAQKSLVTISGGAANIDGVINVGGNATSTGLYVGSNQLSFDGNNVLIPSKIDGNQAFVSCDIVTGAIAINTASVPTTGNKSITITGNNAFITIANTGDIQIQRNWNTGSASGSALIEFGDDGRMVFSASGGGKLTVGGLTTEPVGLQIQGASLRFDNVLMTVP